MDENSFHHLHSAPLVLCLCNSMDRLFVKYSVGTFLQKKNKTKKKTLERLVCRCGSGSWPMAVFLEDEKKLLKRSIWIHQAITCFMSCITWTKWAINALWFTKHQYLAEQQSSAPGGDMIWRLLFVLVIFKVGSSS